MSKGIANVSPPPKELYQHNIGLDIGYNPQTNALKATTTFLSSSSEQFYYATFPQQLLNMGYTGSTWLQCTGVIDAEHEDEEMNVITGVNAVDSNTLAFRIFRYNSDNVIEEIYREISGVSVYDKPTDMAGIS